MGAHPPGNPNEHGAALLRRLAMLAILPLMIVSLLLFTLLGREQARLHDEQARLQARNAALSIALQLGAGQAADEQVTQLPLPSGVARLELVNGYGVVTSRRQARARRSAAGTVEASLRLPDGDGPADARTLVLGWDANAVRAAARADLLRTGAMLAGSLLLILWGGWLAAARAIAPVGELTEAIERIGRGERVQVPVRNDSALARLQIGVNEASQALSNARNRMESELGRTSVELADKNARLEAASHARSRFLAAASHDLRQPLYALTLFSSALRAGESDPVRLARIGHIEECVDSLDHLFSELLDLSRLEAGVMRPAMVAVCLDEVFDEISRNFRMLAEARMLRLVMRKTDAWVHADRTMLARILNNLVSNALRYTREGGVLVGVRHAAPGRIRIDVWDTGSGIAPEDQQRVFDEFYQADQRDDGDAERRRGLGLGLATVRKLAELIDCRVRLASRPGRGTLVSLDLPAAAQVPHPAAMRQVELPLDVSGLRVLVIDDETSILEGLRALLAEWGCRTLAAEDEAGALTALEQARWGSPPDLVISDLRLRNGRSGVQVLQALAARYGGNAETPPFAALLVTGETKQDRLHEVAASRIPVLFKPVSPGKLREAMVAAVFSRHPA